MTVIIPFSGNTMGLAQLLVSLQPQLHPDDDIYIVDSSTEKLAKQVALLYGSTRCYIFVEPTDKVGVEAIQYGLESMKQNKQDGALILYENCVISTTFVANLRRAIGHGDWSILIPHTSESMERLDPNFKWYSSPTTKVVKVDMSEELSKQTPLYIRSTEVDSFYRVDSLKSISNAGRFENELVTILP